MNEIRTDLKTYCRECDLFEPVFEKSGCATVVVCKNKRICEQMREERLQPHPCHEDFEGESCEKEHLNAEKYLENVCQKCVKTEK